MPVDSDLFLGCEWSWDLHSRLMVGQGFMTAQHVQIAREFGVMLDDTLLKHNDGSSFGFISHRYVRGEDEFLGCL